MGRTTPQWLKELARKQLGVLNLCAKLAASRGQKRLIEEATLAIIR